MHHVSKVLCVCQEHTMLNKCAKKFCLEVINLTASLLWCVQRWGRPAAEGKPESTVCRGMCWVRRPPFTLSSVNQLVGGSGQRNSISVVVSGCKVEPDTGKAPPSSHVLSAHRSLFRKRASAFTEHKRYTSYVATALLVLLSNKPQTERNIPGHLDRTQISWASRSWWKLSPLWRRWHHVQKWSRVTKSPSHIA